MDLATKWLKATAEKTGKTATNATIFAPTDKVRALVMRW